MKCARERHAHCMCACYAWPVRCCLHCQQQREGRALAR
jgi:hypothetical protein